MSCNLENQKKGLEETTHGDFAKYEQLSKEKFYSDFIKNKAYRNGKRITAGKTENEIEKCYEHITSKGSMDSSIRLPDLRRYEGIFILKDILTSTHCLNCKNYLVWDKKDEYLKEKIFCPKTGYLIILSKRNFVYKIVSAYFVEREGKRQSLIKEYNTYK